MLFDIGVFEILNNQGNVENHGKITLLHIPRIGEQIVISGVGSFTVRMVTSNALGHVTLDVIRVGGYEHLRNNFPESERVT